MPIERLEAMKEALIAHLNGEPLSAHMIGDIARLIEAHLYGRPRVSKSKDVAAVAIARDVIGLFNVTREDAVEAAFNDPARHVDTLTKQYDRIAPILAAGDRPVAASFDDVIRAYKRTKHYKAKGQKKR